MEMALEPGRQAAIADLEGLIRGAYPSTTFRVRAGADDPGATYLVATVDVEDPDVVGDLVEDYLLDLQLNQGVPVYVLPIHPPERVAETMREAKSRGRSGAHLPSLHP